LVIDDNVKVKKRCPANNTDHDRDKPFHVELSQLPQAAHSQQDYEELIIVKTNNKQKLNQKNIGSGSSDNLNCGTNVAASTLFEQITCSIEEGTPSPGPAIVVKPIVTQRVAEIPVASPITEPIVGEAECNPDEVVTGGGYDITMRRGGPSSSIFVTNPKELAVNNAWHVEVFDPGIIGTMRVYAECLKLVPV
jgi:hypothetical protein